MSKFTIKQFNETYPDDTTCLEELFQARYGNLECCPECGQGAKFHRIKSRKVYCCQFCGYQPSPTANTIFHKSSTSLKSWFYAIYLYANSKNGVSAKELERQLGVTYKTAWRMAKQIRLLFSQNAGKLEGIVEVDETYIGGKGINRRSGRFEYNDKEIIMGMLERGGDVKAAHILNTGKYTLYGEIEKNVAKTSKLMTDELAAYKNVNNLGYEHEAVSHKDTYVVGNVHTNNIEGFWSQLKRSINGTYHSVSGKYLQQYANEFAYRYNHRKSPVHIFHLLLAKAAQPV